MSRPSFALVLSQIHVTQLPKCAKYGLTPDLLTCRLSLGILGSQPSISEYHRIKSVKIV